MSQQQPPDDEFDVTDDLPAGPAESPSQTTTTTTSQTQTTGEAPPPQAARGGTDTAPPAKPGWLVRAARTAGLGEDEIAGLSAEGLRDAVSFLADRQHLRTPPSDVAPQQQPARQQQQAPPEEEDDFDLGLKEDEYDEGIIKALKSVHKTAAQRQRELEKKLAAYEEREQARERKSLVDTIDGSFEALGPGFERFFGAAPGAELARSDAAAMKRRMAVLNAAGFDPKNPPSPKELARAIRAAAEELFGVGAAPAADDRSAGVYGAQPQPQSRPRDPSTGQFTRPAAEADDEETPAERWNRGAVARPTYRAGAGEPDGVAKAKRFFLQGQRDLGLNGVAEEESDLPD